MSTQHGSSVFSSLNAVLHALPHPHFSLRASSIPSKRYPSLQAFETSLAERLDSLKPVGESSPPFLSLAWLHNAMEVVLATHSDVETLIPEPDLPASDRDDKWVDEYLNDSAKLLDVCNVLREGISEVEYYQMLLMLALHSLNSESLNESQYTRARNALHDCKESIKKKDTEYRQGQPKSKLETCSSMLRTMGEKLVRPSGSEAWKGNGFLNAIYGAKATTIFVCGLLVSALACKPRRPLPNLHITSQYMWSSSLTSLQQKVKDETDKRKCRGTIAFLQELDTVDKTVRHIYDLLDRHLTEKQFPLSKEQTDELKQLAEYLRKASKELSQGLGPLEQQINELFRMLVDSRVALLDMLSNSKN